MTMKETARLPVILQPKHYDLQYLRIDLVNFVFAGRVTLHGTALPSVDSCVSIPLHALELQLTQATLVRKTDRYVSYQAEEFRYNLRQQVCEIIFSQESSLIAKEDYELTIDFHGILNDKMHGFYRSSYTALDGSNVTMATTQFEATDARRAFPCLDEPAVKATFQLTVTIPAQLQCISNTPMAATYTTYDDKILKKTIQFQKTPLMSTYLLAWVVGRFDGVSTTSRHIVTTVYTVEGKAAQGQFCLDVASRCLDFYQDIFGIPYPLTKSDLLAIPDFAAGAMENWGCVTYREAKVLVDSAVTSESTKRSIARTVCHELAHQWFGNLVTMDWWTQASFFVAWML